MNSDLWSSPQEGAYKSSSEVSSKISWLDEAGWASISASFSNNNFTLGSIKNEYRSQILRDVPTIDEAVLNAETLYRFQDFKNAATSFHNLWNAGIVAQNIGQVFPTSLKVIGARYIDAALWSADWNVDQMQEVVEILGQGNVFPYKNLLDKNFNLDSSFSNALAGPKGEKDWMGAFNFAKLRLVAKGSQEDPFTEYSFHKLAINAIHRNPDKFTPFEIMAYVKYNQNRYIKCAYDKNLKPIYEESERRLKFALAKSKKHKEDSLSKG